MRTRAFHNCGGETLCRPQASSQARGQSYLEMEEVDPKPARKPPKASQGRPKSSQKELKSDSEALKTPSMEVQPSRRHSEPKFVGTQTPRRRSKESKKRPQKRSMGPPKHPLSKIRKCKRGLWVRGTSRGLGGKQKTTKVGLRNGLAGAIGYYTFADIMRRHQLNQGSVHLAKVYKNL